jgi:ABC-type uncharacterized transport system ATPase subunit
MTSIRLNNVSKTFEDQPVLREVYFRLGEGDRLGLIAAIRPGWMIGTPTLDCFALLAMTS